MCKSSPVQTKSYTPGNVPIAKSASLFSDLKYLSLLRLIRLLFCTNRKIFSISFQSSFSGIVSIYIDKSIAFRHLT